MGNGIKYPTQEAALVRARLGPMVAALVVVWWW